MRTTKQEDNKAGTDLVSPPPDPLLPGPGTVGPQTSLTSPWDHWESDQLHSGPYTELVIVAGLSSR